MTIRFHLVLALSCASGSWAGTPPSGSSTPESEDILFAELPKVEAASLHSQTLAEAPANVTVITAEEIRRYGYRTLGEALSWVRGFYLSYDHAYHFMGVHGFSIPGDYNTRFLVMLNGHPLTENIYNSNGYFGQDFGLDLDLVERIEIIRGPTSALYGSNGMLASINVVTRSPVDSEHLRVAYETSSFGDKKVSVASSVYLGHAANLLVAGSAFDNRGISIPVEGLTLPPGVASRVSNADGERGYHTFLNLIWHDWSVTAFFNQRDKQTPIGMGTSFAGDPNQREVDTRNLLEVLYKHRAGPAQFQWRSAYDGYRYHDRFDYPTGAGVDDVRDFNRGDWLDSQATFDLPMRRLGTLTVGTQGFWELRNQQFNLVNGLIQNPINCPGRGAALFAQQEWKVSRRWKLYGGVRYDYARYFGGFLSPRVALVYEQSPRTVYKVVYGRPFRNPSAFEQFYNDGGLSFAPAPPLRHETAHAWEASIERRLAHNWTVILNGFYYRIEDVIEAVTLVNSVQQYRNGPGDRSAGVEAEVNGKVGKRWEVLASTAYQRTVEAENGFAMANSPHNVSKLRLGTPAGPVFLSAGAQYLSSRRTWTGDTLGGAVLLDATATVRLHRLCDLQAGLRNALDRRYEDPVYLTVDRLRGDGRSAFVKLIWHLWE